MSRKKLIAIMKKRASAAEADGEERIPVPKQRVERFWCKVLLCLLIFDEESDRDHHSQHHSQQESEKKKQKAKRYHTEVSMDERASGADMETQDETPAAGIETTTGDGGEHLPAQADSNSAAPESGVTSEGVHFITIRLFD